MAYGNMLFGASCKQKTNNNYEKAIYHRTIVHHRCGV